MVTATVYVVAQVVTLGLVAEPWRASDAVLAGEHRVQVAYLVVTLAGVAVATTTFADVAFGVCNLRFVHAVWSHTFSIYGKTP